MEMSMVQMQNAVPMNGGRREALATGMFGNVDAFALIFMRMAEGMAEGATQEGETMEDMADGSDATLLADFAAMLHANPLLAAQLPQALEQIPESGMAGLKEMIAQATGSGASKEQLLTMLETAVQTKMNTTTKEQTQTAAFTLDNDDVVETLNMKEMTTTTVTKGSGAQEIMEVQRQFSTAIEVAKRQLQEQKSQEGKTQEVELEAFPVRPEVTTTEVMQPKEVTPMEKPNLAEQIQTEVKTHLSKGDSEFTMKLKPEALGEITVKMMKAGGKVTVQIVVASLQTSQMLNKDIGILREALRPLQAEVQQVITTEETSTQHGMEQFNMQHFAQQNNHGSNRNQGSSTYGDEIFMEEAVEEVVQSLDPDSNLNVFI